MTGSDFLAPAVFAGLSANIFLQLGMGIRQAVDNESSVSGSSLPVLVPHFCAFLFSTLVLSTAFIALRFTPLLGFFEYLFVFPAAVMLHSLLECFLPGLAAGKKRVSGWPSGGASSGVACFLILSLAASFADAVFLSLGFAFGILFAVIAAGEIKRRAGMEAVPPSLRGAPLSLIAMGLLSLVCSSLAAVFFEVLGK